jgi:hypothetical protein
VFRIVFRSSRPSSQEVFLPQQVTRPSYSEDADPPRKLVQMWRMLMDESMAEEGFTRLTYEIEEGKGGVTKLTVTHDLENPPKLAVLVSGGMEDTGAGGGWSWILSDLKSLLETGFSLDWQDPLNQG